MAKTKKIKYYVPGKNHHHRKHYWWRYLLVFLLGQAMVLPEFIITLGTAASSIETGTILDLAGIDASKYLNDNYRDDTLLDLTMDLIAKFSDPNSLTLETFEEISPAIGDLYETYVETYSQQYGITLDETIMKTTPLPQLGDYLLNTLMSVEIGPVLSKIPQVSQFLPPELLDVLLYRVPVASITFQDSTKTNLDLNTPIALIGDDAKYTIETRILPEVASDKKLNWSSKYPDVATVADGVITAVANGQTTITAVANDNNSLVQEVVVDVSGATQTYTPPTPPDDGPKEALVKRDGGKEDPQGQGEPEENPITAIDLSGELKSVFVKETIDTSSLKVTATHQDSSTEDLSNDKVDFVLTPSSFEEDGLKQVSVTASLKADPAITKTKEFNVYIKASGHNHTDVKINSTDEEVPDGYCDQCGELLRIAKSIGDFAQPGFDPLTLLNGLTVGTVVGSIMKDANPTSNPLFGMLWDIELSSLIGGGFDPMSLLGDMTIGGIIQITDSTATKENADPIMQMLWDMSIPGLIGGGLDFGSLLDGKSIGDIMTMVGQSKPAGNPIMDVLWDKGISDLTKGDFIAGLTIKDLLGAQTQKPLAALQNFYLTSAPADIMAIADTNKDGKVDEGVETADILSALQAKVGAEGDDAITQADYDKYADLLSVNPGCFTIANGFDSLALGDLINTGSTGPLAKLANSKISTIADDLNGLSLYELMGYTYEGGILKNASGVVETNQLLSKILTYCYYDDKDTKKENPIYLNVSNLGTKMGDVINTFTIADALNKDPSELIAQGGLFGKLANCTLGGDSLTNAFNSLQICDVMKPTSYTDLTSGTITSENFATENAKGFGLYTKEDGNKYQKAVSFVTGKTYATATCGNPLLDKLADCYVTSVPTGVTGGRSLTDGMNALQLKDVINPTGNMLLESIQDCYLFTAPTGGKTMSDAISELQLKNVMNTEGNQLLTTLGDCYLFGVPTGKTGTTMSSKMNELKLSDIMTPTEADGMLYELRDCYLFNAPTGGQTLSQGMSNISLISVMKRENMAELGVYLCSIESEDEFNNLCRWYGKVYTDENCETELSAYSDPVTVYYKDYVLKGIWSLMFENETVVKKVFDSEDEFNKYVFTRGGLFTDNECETEATDFVAGTYYFYGSAYDAAAASTISNMGTLFSGIGNKMLTTPLYELVEKEILPLKAGANLDNPLSITVSDTDLGLPNNSRSFTIKLDKDGYSKFTLNAFGESDFTAYKTKHGTIYTCTYDEVSEEYKYETCNEFKGAGDYYYEKPLGEYSLTEIINVLASLGGTK